MIIEGLLTTESTDGQVHVAPMGPVVNLDLTEWVLRPFQTSTTFQLLRRSAVGVFHVVDDVVPVVQAALGLPVELDFKRLPNGGWLIQQACHWYQLEVYDWDLSSQRSQAIARVTDRGTLRPFWGWNRAKHAVLEGAILATRLHLIGAENVWAELSRWQPMIDKTAGDRERCAWEMVQRYIQSQIDGTGQPSS